MAISEWISQIFRDRLIYDFCEPADEPEVYLLSETSGKSKMNSANFYESVNFWTFDKAKCCFVDWNVCKRYYQYCLNSIFLITIFVCYSQFNVLLRREEDKWKSRHPALCLWGLHSHSIHTLKEKTDKKYAIMFPPHQPIKEWKKIDIIKSVQMLRKKSAY